jgi:hypothetical protein
MQWPWGGSKCALGVHADTVPIEFIYPTMTTANPEVSCLIAAERFEGWKNRVPGTHAPRVKMGTDLGTWLVSASLFNIPRYLGVRKPPLTQLSGMAWYILRESSTPWAVKALPSERQPRQPARRDLTI